MSVKTEIIERLRQTKRKGIENLITEMDNMGFFTSPCSTRFHLACEGGLAQHSLNVCNMALNIADTVGFKAYNQVVIASLLHDLGKAGQYGKAGYVENVLKSGKVSDAEPYKSNPELIKVPHEVRSISIAKKFIDLNEQEEVAILFHNGLYGDFKYELQGNEQKLYLILHFADMWVSRFEEVGA